jgi:hypothetical protein
MNFSQGDSCPLRIRLRCAPAMRFPPAEIQENYRTLAKSWSNNHLAGPSSELMASIRKAQLVASRSVYDIINLEIMILQW